MTYTQSLFKNLRHILHQIGGYKTNKVCVVIDDKIHYMNEYELRAMQLYVNAMTDDEYAEFCKRVTIYSGRYKCHSDHVVTIYKDGRLAQSFEDGFYTTSDRLSMELLMRLPRLS